MSGEKNMIATFGSRDENVEKWKRMCEVNIRNLLNTKKRLSKRKSLSNFVLVYYSIFLIINTLIIKYFPERFNPEISEFFSVIISIILLTYSLINQNAKYSERIERLEESINTLKTIKRSINQNNLEEQISLYTINRDRTEMRSDGDFFKTVVEFCREYDIKWYICLHNINAKDDDPNIYIMKSNIKKYLSQINRYGEFINIIVVKFLDVIIVISPIVVVAVCYLCNM